MALVRCWNPSPPLHPRCPHLSPQHGSPQSPPDSALLHITSHTLQRHRTIFPVRVEEAFSLDKIIPSKYKINTCIHIVATEGVFACFILSARYSENYSEVLIIGKLVTRVFTILLLWASFLQISVICDVLSCPCPFCSPQTCPLSKCQNADSF